MRYAIISDVHANWQAWSAVLADIHENNADAIICLGDVVGYGPRPEEVLNGVRQATRNFVVGNHDAAACGLLDASIFNDHARSVVEWTTKQLSQDSLNFLRQVPLTMETEDILFVHAEIQQPDRFGYIESEEEALHHAMFTKANIAFYGHTHKPMAYSLNDDGIKTLPDSDFTLAPGHRYLVNVGSAGEPRDPDDIRARYVLYDSERRTVYFRKVKFDVEAYRQDLKAVGLNIQPYFLSLIDHEATQGRNPLDRLDDHMMSVPDKPLFTGNKTAAQKIVLGGNPGAAHVPAPAQATTQPAAPPPAAKAGDALMESLPPPPVIEESGPVINTPRTNAAAPAPRAALPKPAAQQNNTGFIIFILAIILVAFAISMMILFS